MLKCPHCGKDIEEKTFILHWLEGDETQVHGLTITDAVRKAGYGQGAMAALDYWKEVKP